jgi:hypothetical protein
MKNLTTKIFALTAIFFLFLNQSTNAQSTGCDSLNTLYAYTYLNHGAMFDVIADSAVTLEHLTANLNDGTANIKIYYKTGSFLNYETQPSAWTLIDSAMVLSNNTLTLNNQPTVIPINLNLTMNPGDTIAFYIVSMPLSFIYLTSTTTPWGNIYSSDGNISISIARSVYQLFNVPFSTPQIWNGSVSYCSAQSTGIEGASNEWSENIKVFNSGNSLIAKIPLEVVSGKSNLELSLYNLLGEMVLNVKVVGGINAFDLSSLPTGIYTCTVHDESRVFKSIKVIN